MNEQDIETALRDVEALKLADVDNDLLTLRTSLQSVYPVSNSTST